MCNTSHIEHIKTSLHSFLSLDATETNYKLLRYCQSFLINKLSDEISFLGNKKIIAVKQI